MHSFRSVVIVKHPVEAVWTALRDNLAQIGPLVSDVRSVEVLERNEASNGTLVILNEWRLDLNLPAAARALVQPEQLGWRDHARWDATSKICSWDIRPFLHADAINCSGETSYAPAIGGRGTRVTFSGDIGIDTAKLQGMLKVASLPISGIIESVITTVLPRNFRKIYVATESWLSERAAD